MRGIPENSVDCCVTSPPYWGLRDYGVEGQLGLEKTPEEYTEKLVEVFREVRRVLKPAGTLWLNLGDSYCSRGKSGQQGKHGERFNRRHTQRNLLANSAAASGLKPKDLVGIPWRVAFALQKDGWYLRQDIIWHKPNPMPESVRDRCTKAHEYIFMLAKSKAYHFDQEAIKEPTKAESLSRMNRVWNGNTQRGMPDTFKPHSMSHMRSGNKERKQRPSSESLDIGNQAGSIPWEDKYGKRNRRSVWTVTTKSFKGAHFATFPPDLIEPCILAGCPEGGTVLDPFFGAGTSGLVAQKHGRNWIGVELNPVYIEIAKRRLS